MGSGCCFPGRVKPLINDKLEIFGLHLLGGVAEAYITWDFITLVSQSKGDEGKYWIKEATGRGHENHA